MRSRRVWSIMASRPTRMRPNQEHVYGAGRSSLSLLVKRGCVACQGRRTRACRQRSSTNLGRARALAIKIEELCEIRATTFGLSWGHEGRGFRVLLVGRDRRAAAHEIAVSEHVVD